MPNRTIYILDGDLKKWEKIRNRSAWIHQMLNQTIGIDTSNGTVVVSSDPKETNHLVKIPNVPKPPGISDISWLNHLKKHGLDPHAKLVNG